MEDLYRLMNKEAKPAKIELEDDYEVEYVLDYDENEYEVGPEALEAFKKDYGPRAFNFEPDQYIDDNPFSTEDFQRFVKDIIK